MRDETFNEGLAAFRVSKRLRMGEPWAIKNEDTITHGYDGHYFYHTAWAARKLAEFKPEFHVDVASQLQFVTILSAFIPTIYYELRRPNIDLSNLVVLYGNILEPFLKENSVKSLSCMHTIEHIGLGRYGDPIDPDGDLKAAQNLTRALAPGGRLLMVTPVGVPRVIYNAHRIYSYQMVRDMFAPLKEIEFTLYSENDKKLYEHADPVKVISEGSIYGACGMWVFEK